MQLFRFNEHSSHYSTIFLMKNNEQIFLFWRKTKPKYKKMKKDAKS